MKASSLNTDLQYLEMCSILEIASPKIFKAFHDTFSISQFFPCFFFFCGIKKVKREEKILRLCQNGILYILKLLSC